MIKYALCELIGLLLKREQIKAPQSAVSKQAYRNPALARTVPSPAVRAPSILFVAVAQMRLTATEGGLQTSRRKSGLLFTLCGFYAHFYFAHLRELAFDDCLNEYNCKISLRHREYPRIRRQRYPLFRQIHRHPRWFRECPHRFRQRSTSELHTRCFPLRRLRLRE